MNSSGRREAQARTALISAETLVGIGGGSVKGDGTARYIPYPQPHARQDDVEPGEIVTFLKHAPTGALIVLPPGVSRADF
jgi:alcohol dehydrogenase class IV